MILWSISHLLTVLCSKSTLSTSQSPSNTPHLMASLQRFYQPLWVDSQPPIPPQSKVLRVLYPKRIPKTVGSLKHNLHNQFLSRLCFPFCSRPRFSCSPVFLLCVLKGIIKITCCLCIPVHSHQFPRDTHKYSWYTHGYFMNLPWIFHGYPMDTHPWLMNIPWISHVCRTIRTATVLQSLCAIGHTVGLKLWWATHGVICSWSRWSWIHLANLQ